MMTCPVCAQSFTPVGRRAFCSDACRQAAYRRRKTPAPVVVVPPAPAPRKPITVYQCDQCGAVALGDQRCGECGTFMSKVGFGGLCPHCSEPVTIAELLDQ